jgi:hypothetical protein
MTHIPVVDAPVRPRPGPWTDGEEWECNAHSPKQSPAKQAARPLAPSRPISEAVGGWCAKAAPKTKKLMFAIEGDQPSFIGSLPKHQGMYSRSPADKRMQPRSGHARDTDPPCLSLLPPHEGEKTESESVERDERQQRRGRE